MTMRVNATIRISLQQVEGHWVAEAHMVGTTFGQPVADIKVKSGPNFIGNIEQVVGDVAASLRDATIEATKGVGFD